jgi:hypothetical protein
MLQDVIESNCTTIPQCIITYDDSQSAILSTTSDLIPVDGVVTITGTGFGANPVAYIGDYAQETISSSATEIKIKLIKFDDNEQFNFEVRTDSINLPTISIAKPLTQTLLSISPNSGSSGGEKI